jgi:flavin-dependent dehydrogenase
MEVNEHDLVVIGSGPAGQKAAICTAKMRKKVAIIDCKKTIRGVLVHSGTIPSKTLREAVLYLSGFRQRTFYGPGPYKVFGRPHASCKLSYKRRCQEKKLLPPLHWDVDVVACIQLRLSPGGG